MASYPFPSFNNLCPGKTDKIVSSSGAPKKILGIKSRKVCAIDIDTINMTIIIGLNIPSNTADKDISIDPTKLICIPGVKPVRVPKAIPNNNAISSSINIIMNVRIFYKHLLI